MKKLSLLLMSIVLAVPSLALAGGSRGGGSRGGGSRGVSRSSSGRSASRRASSTRTKRASSGTHRTRRAAGVTRGSHGKIKRSGAAKRAFMRSNPCPSTGKTSRRCPGYVVDHRVALKRGGADAPSNMQWQSIAAAKTKDRVED
jgi:hypothetical protein